MSNNVTIYCTNNKTYTDFPAGTSLLQMQKQLIPNSQFSIINAKVNNKTESLSYCAYNNKTVTFVTVTEASGMRSYVRSLCFLLAKAADEVAPGAQLYIEHPISLGYFCKLNAKGVDQKMVDAIKAKMQEFVKADMPYVGVEEETTKVVELFRQKGYEDKAILLETSGALYSKYYKLGDAIDYFYGCLAPSTSYISLFDLELFNDGLLLRVPNRDNPVELEPFIDQSKMYNVYKEHLKFLNIIGLDNVGDLNKANLEHRTPGIIKVSEALQERSIAKIAEQIADRADKGGVRVVLISGPSSSGKTTFRMRLEVQLMVNLLKPVGLSLDDYFVDRDKTPLDENGGYDFESLHALDIPQFNKDLEALLKGERVSLPTYNFTTGKREYKGHELQLTEDNILVIEGIHGLNPDLTSGIPEDKKFKVYVSALTAISLDDHNWISTTDNRLLRRLVRDYRYRNYSAIDTISRWPSVRKGEEKWIFPYQENADVMFNSAMIYELAALRRRAEPILNQVPNNAPEYAEAHRLLKFLNYFTYINDNELPPTSLLREFLGGSSFKY